MPTPKPRFTRYVGWITVNGIRPLELTKKQACVALNNTTLVRRLLYAASKGTLTKDGTPWLIVSNMGRHGSTLKIDCLSLEEAFARYRLGEEPPLMPSQMKEQTA